MEDIIVKNGEEKTGGEPIKTEPPITNEPEKDVSNKPSFTDDTVLWDEDGKPVLYKEAKAGYLRQSDYSRKTQELAKEKEKYSDYAALSEWLNDPANSDRAEKILAILENKEPGKVEEGVTEGGLDPNDPKDKIILDLLKRVDASEKNQQQVRFSNAQSEIDSEISQVKEKYKLQDGDEDLGDIIAIAIGRNGKDKITTIADKYFDRLAKRDKTTIKSYLEGKEKDGKKINLPSGGGTPAETSKKLSLEDGSAKRAFAERLREAAKAAND